MTFLSALEQIEKSDAFKNFKEKHPDAELCAGFFVITDGKTEQQQLDYILADKRIYTFILNDEITLKEAEVIEEKKQSLPPLDRNIKVDLDDVEKILAEKMQQSKIVNKINKIIAVLQKHEGRQIWNLNCMLSNMEILQLHINTETGDISKFEKKSMMDFIKRVK